MPITGRQHRPRDAAVAARRSTRCSGRLEQDGYVTRARTSRCEFTDDGLEQAEAIVGRHRLIERFLTDVVGIAWDDVHEEAEKLEHAMSPAFEKWMMSAVGDAKTCPHGHPIVPGNRIPGVPLADVEVGAEVEILRFENEAEDLLHYLKRLGPSAGAQGQAGLVERRRGRGRNRRDTDRGHPQRRRDGVGAADPSPPPRTALPEQLVLGKDRYGR